MYIVHIVQAHANVRPRAPRCSPAPQGNTRSRHTWSSSSREPSVIYVPPLEQGVVYRAGSTLYATPAPQQVWLAACRTAACSCLLRPALGGAATSHAAWAKLACVAHDKAGMHGCIHNCGLLRGTASFSGSFASVLCLPAAHI